MSGEKYRILRSLNMTGTVTLAQNTENGRRFVLKELTEESLPIYRRISEIPMGENLMQVHELFRQDGQTVAVCGFAEGKPLDELLNSGKVFPIEELCSITSQLCRAAEQLHRNSIIHRDINPKNIILDEKLNLTLIDYGISRLFTGNREQDTTLYGTEGFSPPEQYGFRETRFTADIYAIGMVMKLLLNVCPNCPTAQEVLLRKIAAKCTRFVPEKRYGSAGAVRRAVNRSRRVIPAGITAACAAVLAGVIAAVMMFLNVNTDPPPISEVQQLPLTSAKTSASATAQTVTPAAETSASTTPQTVTTSAETSASTTPQTVTTSAKTSASTTPQTVTTSVTEATQPQELHTSDRDNPDKITVTTRLNDRGYYEDFFSYQFYDDHAVHGQWSYFTTISSELVNANLTADRIKNYNFEGGHVFSELMFEDNGKSRCILDSGEPMPISSCWTNGYLICDYYEGTAAQQLFAVTLDEQDYLFLGLKTGDFHTENRVPCYIVYTRTE